MLLTKIKNIKQFAVFKDFSWDSNVKFFDGTVAELKKINILYGRNYSGKTTLSRILRALEKKEMPLHYGDATFTLCWEDKSETTESNLDANTHNVRVFNDDFVRENLAFITNSDASINSFAIIGEDNVKISDEITAIKEELGESDSNRGRTKMYATLDSLKQVEEKLQQEFEESRRILNSTLQNKANGDRTSSIKYQPHLYGDQNYSVAKLQNEILIVNTADYRPLSREKQEEVKRIILSTAKDAIVLQSELNIDVEGLKSRVRQLVEQKVGKTETIEELVRDALLNDWVQQGCRFHKGKRTVCAFCGHEITEDRWKKLTNHFNEESERLKHDLSSQIEQMRYLQDIVGKGYGLQKEMVYANFENNVNSFNEEYARTSKSVIEQLGSLIQQLTKRKEQSLYEPIEYTDITIDVDKMHNLYVQYVKICKDSNDYTNNLQDQQNCAKEQLRHQVIYDFLKEISYNDLLAAIKHKQVDADKAKNSRLEFEKIIKEKEEQILYLQQKLNDEEKGAEQVNTYLNNYFGHKYLSLRAIKDEDTSSHFRFEVFRNKAKAYNLSEGECSLVAFCYFMAKLHDSITEGTKPIIWIDDPISSLDSNHIFFVFSLIDSEIVEKEDFEQLFLSTHNLDFLKYLKRLHGVGDDLIRKEQKKKYRFLVLNREDEQSRIGLMPKYMCQYVTEFNFLFKQIYDCSQIVSVTDSNYHLFYNFGNNARKFLELFLYFKYPDDTKDVDKYKKFFGDDSLLSILTMRINNEYSHLSGTFERGEILVEVPEMKKVADLIINTIRDKDSEQYNALLRSIGETSYE